MNAMLEDHLTAVELLIAETKRHVNHQRELVAELESDGHDTSQATRLLAQLEEVLATQIAERDRVRKELGLSTG
jgi:arginine repressor